MTKLEDGVEDFIKMNASTKRAEQALADLEARASGRPAGTAGGPRPTPVIQSDRKRKRIRVRNARRASR